MVDLEASSLRLVEGESDETLVFESRFESGNLRRAIQVSSRTLSHERAVLCSSRFDDRGDAPLSTLPAAFVTFCHSSSLFFSLFGTPNLTAHAAFAWDAVLQVYDHEYDLILRPDINTRGHTQWFYFSVSNTRKGIPYKLNIINMVKSDSLFQVDPPQ
eukprot:286313-Prorocentrum_minimum.AAC.1